jgi:KipI family sensor histidine kinase inhibitor
MTNPLDRPKAKSTETGRHPVPPCNIETMVSRETGPLRWMTDRGLCVATGTRTLALFRQLTEARLPGILEVVPADGMLLAVVEAGTSTPPGLLDILSSTAPEATELFTHEHRIPVHFDGEDLAEAAERAGLTVDGLAELLCSQTLRVKFLGFQPGFAYLDGLPPELHLPRRASPRKMVPAGSVALGGGYCGIYPTAGPGGWHLVGTTELSLFDPGAEPPARLQPGDTVRLVAAC